MSEQTLYIIPSLFLGTLVLEDAATASGALLAADGKIHVFLAFLTVFLGIVAGDLMLYGLGYAARKIPRLKALLEHKKMIGARQWADGRFFITTITARFIPGMRLPTYTAFGFMGLGFWRFTVIVVFAVGLWTCVLFFALYFIGAHIFDLFGPWRWGIGLGLIILVIILPQIARLWTPNRYRKLQEK